MRTPCVGVPASCGYSCSRPPLHEPGAVAQAELKVPRGVAEDVSVVAAQVRRCAPLAIIEHEDSVRAARCHVASRDQRSY
jgi:hypothetical protein